MAKKAAKKSTKSKADEPVYVAETDHPLDVASPKSRRIWFDEQSEKAAKKGGKFPRETFDEVNGRLLYESWKTIPKSRGDLRWKGK